MRTAEDIARIVAINTVGEASLNSDIGKAIYNAALAGIQRDRSQISIRLEEAANEWEASGDDEKLVNEVIDPLIKFLSWD